MSLINLLLGDPAIRSLNPHQKDEVNRLTTRLVAIGQSDDFLSLIPGGLFDAQCHNREAKDIGRRLYDIGGVDLMTAVRARVKRKLKDVLAEHLDHAWKGVGTWTV